MQAYYLYIKLAHIGLVLGSGALFAVRGLMLQLGMRWPMAKPVRRLSIVIDTCLLISAILLLVILHLNPVETAWLATKIILLLVYIVLGVLALHRARTRRKRLIAYLAALAVFAFIYSVARAHHPYGWFLSLMA